VGSTAASFHTATTIMQPSAVPGSPSQLRLAIPKIEVNCSSSPYCGVKKKSQMLATAIIGRMVGVKNAMRSQVRPRIAEFTHSAITMASAIDMGMVPSAYQRLFTSERRNTSSAIITW
jgi:hypothetical protein